MEKFGKLIVCVVCIGMWMKEVYLFVNDVFVVLFLLGVLFTVVILF